MYKMIRKHIPSKSRTEGMYHRVLGNYERNGNFRGFVAHTSFLAETENAWYFDNGCSRHMTGKRESLINIRPVNGQTVTFADGVKVDVLGDGELSIPGMPRLKNVFLVDQLKANLVSISQLCDQGMDI